MRQRKRLTGLFTDWCSADNRSGLGAAGKALLMVGISIGVPINAGGRLTNGADQSSTRVRLSTAGKIVRSKFLKMCGSGQERRCAHSISVVKIDDRFLGVLLTRIRSLEHAFVIRRNWPS